MKDGDKNNDGRIDFDGERLRGCSGSMGCPGYGRIWLFPIIPPSRGLGEPKSFTGLTSLVSLVPCLEFLKMMEGVQ